MDEKLQPCPECGSDDVTDVLLHSRPNCKKCGYWAPQEWGTREEARRKWNESSKARFAYREKVPAWGVALQKRVTALEKTLKKYVHKMDKSDLGQ